MNHIPFGQRIRQPFEHHNAHAAAADRTIGRHIKAATVAVGREDHPLLVEIPSALVSVDGHPAGQRHVTFAITQRLDSQMHSHQRGRTGGLHGDAGTSQVQFVGEAGGQKVLAIGGHRLVDQGARDLGPFIARQFGLIQIGVEPRAGIDADAAAILLGDTASLFQSFPGTLQKEPHLRVQQFSFAAGKAKEISVKLFNLGQ